MAKKCIICGGDTAALARVKRNDGTYVCTLCSRDILGKFTLEQMKSATLDELIEAKEIGKQNLEEMQELKNSFVPTKKYGNFVWFDDKNEMFSVQKPFSYERLIINYDELVDCDLLEDGTSVIQGGLGKALVGGAIFGVAGAVAGGTSKKTKMFCTKLQIKITTKNELNPVIFIDLIKTQVKRNSMVYNTNFKLAQEIISIFQIISSKQEESQQSVQQIVQENPLSSADEIAKFKKLLDEGVITQEEFEMKKKQLLGL